MLITHLKLKNWRNFRELDVPLRDVTYVLGANASGKSNLLDVFRFLRDVSKPRGGGLQAAVEDKRGGISKLRCLHARRDPEVLIHVELSERQDDPPVWVYVLGFKSEGKGAQRIVVSREEVIHKGKTLLKRPNKEDKEDTTLLTQTHLEQIQANARFRELVDFFSGITYLHLVPQLLKYSDQIGGRVIEDDPFGQGFLERLAKTNEKTRNARLGRLKSALQLAVPQFKELEFVKDEMGHPHLRALYAHHRPNAGWQTEEQFSDGTLRLIGLLWSLLENNSILLLEEPEISLNEGIVGKVPELIDRIHRSRKTRTQTIISTHSEALLSNPGIDGRGVVVLEIGPQGTVGRSLQSSEKEALDAGLSVAEVVLPKTRPKALGQLGFWE